MFTGIVQAVGRIVSVTPGPAAMRIGIDPQALPLDDVAIGDSIAVNGCCLTVVARNGALAFDVSHETLQCTAGLDRNGPVNLEKALRLSDRLGGHLMSGHVDGVGRVVAFDEDESSRRLVVDVPPELAHYIAPKGSIAVQGVSLTVNRVDDTAFEVNLIPHTLVVTTLGTLHVNARVNLEVDLIARYVARLAER
ncbi:MAG TPA: riboflavin synthase [Casimicrobiaceae bacterium]|nr:riboflavin synthase [Casimicrobiaceae bacterium]